MGATNSYRNFHGDLGRAEIQKQWNEAVDNSLHEDGHSCSGEIGMLGKRIKWHDREMESEYAACDFIDEKHKKGDDPLAVSYIENGKKMWVIGGWCSC